jgi:hypothetical protein
MKHLAPITASILVMLGLGAAQTFTFEPDTSCAPTGTHLQTGATRCQCVDGTVSCTGFQLCGVGSSEATVRLASAFTAVVQCTNPGGNTVDVKTGSIDVGGATQTVRARRGCVSSPALTTAPRPSDSVFENAATCPNENWSKDVVASSITNTFDFSLTFSDFSCPYLTSSGLSRTDHTGGLMGRSWRRGTPRQPIIT